MSAARTFAVMAHVDAGKTTLCEQLLLASGALRRAGRVDHGDTALDVDPIERERGITVFSGQAWLAWQGRRLTLIDTPGHVDFASETARALTAADLCVLVVDGTARVDAHTAALFALAAERGLPTLLFLNKTDLPGFSLPDALRRLRERLAPQLVPVSDGAPDIDALSLLDDGSLERCLEGTPSTDDAWDTLAALFARRGAFPVLLGAALRGQGVSELLDAVARLSDSLPEPPADGAPEALVYQVRRDQSGERVCFLKVLAGTLRPRDAFDLPAGTEKIHQLRLYRGAAFTPANEARAGDVVGATGLTAPRCGDILRPDGLTPSPAPAQPVLAVRVEPPEGTPPTWLMECLRLLEDEDPALCVAWDAEHACATVRVMGPVQIEVLARLLMDRFGLDARLLPPHVLYRETIAGPAVGCGHYEPLRHYAEAHLLLSPGPRGSGVTFDSRCHVDDLPAPYQSLIRTHVLEREHRGILTGAPLSDVRVTLLSGRAHLKHTEGGDFRQAVYRAIRQALMKAGCVLLEPYYRFSLTVPAEHVGRVMTDLAAMGADCGAPETQGACARLSGRGPVAALMDYPAALRALTHGEGEISLLPDGYDPCRDPAPAVAVPPPTIPARTRTTPRAACSARTARATSSPGTRPTPSCTCPWSSPDGAAHPPGTPRFLRARPPRFPRLAHPPRIPAHPGPCVPPTPVPACLASRPPSPRPPRFSPDPLPKGGYPHAHTAPKRLALRRHGRARPPGQPAHRR